MRNLPYGSRPLIQSDDIFIISDVHGELDKLKNLITKLPLTPTSIIVLVGDLIDKGPDGIGVLLFIQQLKKRHQVYVIEGNHERIFKRILEGTYAVERALDPAFLEEFYYYGAKDLSIKELNRIIKGYQLNEVLDSLIPYFETQELIVTHAPLENRVWQNLNFDEWQNDNYLDNDVINNYPLDHLFNIEALLWAFIRDESEEVKNLNKFLVSGHQHFSCQYLEPRVFPNRACLDCGAGYNKTKPVFAFHFPSKTLYASS